MMNSSMVKPPSYQVRKKNVFLDASDAQSFEIRIYQFVSQRCETCISENTPQKYDFNFKL